MLLAIDRYPLEENVRENKAEDERCLAKVKDGERTLYYYSSVLAYHSLLAYV